MRDRAKAVGWLFFVMTVWVIGFSLLGGPILGKLSMAGQLVGSQLVYLVPVLLFLLIFRVKIAEWIPHGKIRLSTVLMTLLFVVLLQPLMLTLNIFTMLFSNNYVMQTEAKMADMSPALKLLVIAVVPAISEEFMFRGVFFGAYREKGIFAAALFSGLVFGALHLNFNQFAYALVMGIAFGFLLEATGNLFYCMVGHFLINGWSVLLTLIQEPLLKWAETVSGQENQVTEVLTREDLVNAFCVYAPVAAVAVCLAFAVLIWIAKHSGRLEQIRSERPRLFFTPVFGLALAICVGFMVFRDFVFAGIQ